MRSFFSKYFNKYFSSKEFKGMYFIHIPKTAGTSFINVLDACVGVSDIFPCQLWQEINSDIVARKSQYKLLRGHFGGGSYRLLTSGNPHRLTLLRDPQSLSLSTYHFIKREKNTAVHDLVKDKNMDLRAFLEEPLTAHKINNRMVRHLSFDLGQDPEAQELFLSAQSIKVVNEWIKTPKRITNDKRLQRAKKALTDCSWFGILEKFDDSMQLFSYVFKRPPVGDSPHLNAHKSQNEEPDNYCKNLIAQENEHDNALYQFGLQMFEDRMADMHKQLQQLSTKKLSTNELLDLNYQKHCIRVANEHENYVFDRPLLGSGWHRRELTQPEATYFRWTNRVNSYLDFWMKPQDYHLSIRIINSVSVDHLEQLDLLINNNSIPYEYDQNEGVVRVLKAPISKSFFKSNLLRIHFNHGATQSHAQIFDSNDQRNLGIAINWVKILPCTPKK